MKSLYFCGGRERESEHIMGHSSSDDGDFSVLVFGSDFAVDARTFLLPPSSSSGEDEENWHDCPGEDFSDIDQLQAFRLEGTDKAGNRILRIVGKFFPALIISGERLKKYIYQKILTEFPEGTFCIVYMHSDVQKVDNSPGLYVLRWIYEELPSELKERLRVVYFLHPGIRSRLVLATLGRFFLSGGLYWKIKYMSRLQYLWEDIQKGQVEIPQFVKSHDDILEHRPLTDYGIEPDPFHLTDPLHLTEIPSMEGTYGRHGDRWSSSGYA